MKILFVTKFLPLPADSGGKQRSAAVLRRLVDLGEVTVAALDDGTADRAAFSELGVRILTAPRPGRAAALRGAVRTQSLTAGRFASRELLREVRRATVSPPDCLVVAYGQLAPYAATVPAGHKVLDLHNVESALMASYASSRGSIAGLPARLESAALRRLERQALDAFDTISVVSDLDRARLPGVHPRLLVCPNGWEPSPPLPPTQEPVVTFVALLGWTPNVDAASWLARSIWPLVRQDVPGARLLLVGRDPSPSVRALAEQDITVTGTVPDVAPYLASALVSVAPLRSGGGSRLKILEALDAGRPVVATTVGAEGLESLVGKGLLIADDPRSFADTVVRLLRDPSEAIELGRAGSRAVAEQFSWDQTLAPLLDVICGGGRAP